MFSQRNLVTAVFLAVAASASPLSVRDDSSGVTLAFATQLNITAGVTVADLDRRRASHLMNLGQQMESFEVNGTLNDLSLAHAKRASSFNVNNNGVTYTTSVQIGTPATSYTLLIDTGSSNTWVGAGKAYAKTSSSKSTGNKVSINYGSGSFSGIEYTDTVAISSSLNISQQSIGVANTSSGFANVDGILGIGPVALTSGTVQNTNTVPTVSDNLKIQNKISTEVIGISYNPTNTYSTANGELTFGGLDSSKYTGSITYAPITTKSPAKYYWGIDQTVTYGSSPVLASTGGIVDTGTTLVLIASDAFSKYQNYTGGTIDSATGLLKITSAQYNNLQNLNFVVNGQTFALTPNAQIWPRALNTYIGGTSGSIYLIVSNLGRASGSGLDFINGYTFLERFYSVYDTTNNRVGLATTSNTKSTIN